MRKDTAEGNCSADKGIEFFVAADGELQVSRCDALDLQIFGGVTGKFENFSSKVFEDGRDVDSGCARTRLISARNRQKRRRPRTFSTDSHLVLGVVLEETLDTTAGELTTNLLASHPRIA